MSRRGADAAGVEPVAKKVNGKSIKAKVGKRPQDWTAAEKLEAVLESASLSEQELGEYLRRKGLHEAQLEQWRRRVTEASMEALQSKSSRKKASVEAKRVRALERELRRKEKALAETAALLVLKKKRRRSGGTRTTPRSGRTGNDPLPRRRSGAFRSSVAFSVPRTGIERENDSSVPNSQVPAGIPFGGFLLGRACSRLDQDFRHLVQHRASAQCHTLRHSRRAA